MSRHTGLTIYSLLKIRFSLTTYMPAPEATPLETAVKRALESEVARIVDEEVAAARTRVESRIRSAAALVGFNVSKHMSITHRAGAVEVVIFDERRG